MSHATIPSKIGKYEIIRLVAQSNDIVYEAWDASTSRRVAVKELAIPAGATASQTQERIERFQREARAAGKLTHPNIATVYEVGTDGYRHFIAMEFVEGETLGEVISRSHSVTKYNIRSYVRQLLHALQCAHASGVVHRDVKPQNVFLTKTGVIKLADFGIARIEVEPTITIDGQIFGTPSYMAPEQFQGGVILPCTDLWAIGVIAYELATGEKPFVGQGLLDIYHQIQTKTPDLTQIKDSNLKLLLTQLLEKDPAIRLQTAHDAISILDSTDSQPATPAVQSTVTTPSPPSGSGSLGKRIALVSSFLVISAAAFFAGRFNAASTGQDAFAIRAPSPSQPLSETGPGSNEEGNPNDPAIQSEPETGTLSQPGEADPRNLRDFDPYVGELQSPQVDESSETASKDDEPAPSNVARKTPRVASKPRPLNSRSQPSSPQAEDSTISNVAFTIGSTEGDVLSVQGTPTKITEYGSRKTLHYGISDVDLINGVVTKYDNIGSNLRVVIAPKVRSNARNFTIGSSEDEVLSVQGTPTKITEYGSRKTLHYGISDVDLINGVVTKYDNIGSNLRIVIAPKVRSNASTYTIGSSEDDVLSVQGTPTKITEYGSRKTLHYGISDVDLINGVVTTYDNIGSNLKVK